MAVSMYSFGDMMAALDAIPTSPPTSPVQIASTTGVKRASPDRISRNNYERKGKYTRAQQV